LQGTFKAEPTTPEISASAKEPHPKAVVIDTVLE